MRKILYLGLDPSRFARADAEIFHYPVIQIVPYSPSQPDIQESLRLFHAFTHLIFTSRTSIQLLLPLLPPQALSQKKIIVVGQATALSLQEYGYSPDITAAEETSEGIVTAMLSEDLTQAYLLWPHSALSRPILRNFFQLESIAFHECLLYTTVACQSGPLPDFTHFDEIIFTSPSTVDAFAALKPSIPNSLQLTPLGLITANYLKIMEFLIKQG